MFGDILKKLREQSGVSQRKLAEEIHVSQQTVGSWEVNRTTPNPDIMNRVADYFNVSLDYLLGRETTNSSNKKTPRIGVKIPVLGYVPAGIPLEAVEDILDYEEISPEMARNGEHFALKIKGDSMIPDIKNGDVVIIRIQPDVESGEIAIVKVNGDEATCKRVVKHKTGISIVANNPNYEPVFFTNKEIEELPVTVVGKVVELRRSF